MSPLQTEFIGATSDETADRLLVEMTCHEMSQKLAKSRGKGRRGWHTTSCNSDELLEMMKAHIRKGDMIDVINLAAMIHARGMLYGDVPDYIGGDRETGY